MWLCARSFCGMCCRLVWLLVVVWCCWLVIGFPRILENVSHGGPDISAMTCPLWIALMMLFCVLVFVRSWFCPFALSIDMVWYCLWLLLCCCISSVMSSLRGRPENRCSMMYCVAPVGLCMYGRACLMFVS